MAILFADILSPGSNNDSSGNNLGVAANAIVDSYEVLGGVKKPVATLTLANGLWESMDNSNGVAQAIGEFNTLRCLSSLVYVNEGDNPGFRVLTGTQGDSSTYAWEALGSHLGIAVGSLKIQDPGTTASPTDDFTTGAIEVASLRLGSLDEGGLTVTQTNEVTDAATVDTLRVSLKNSAGLTAAMDMDNGESYKILMWNDDENQLEASPITVDSDGTNETLTVNGSLTVTGTLTQGVNVTATSLDVTNQYIKSNDGYENINNATALSQGGFLVQTGITTDDGLQSGTITKYNQRGFYWDGAEESWYIGAFDSDSTASDATYTEVTTLPDGTSFPHIPVFKLATAAYVHLPNPASGGFGDSEAWNFHYMTPNAAFTSVGFGSASSAYDIDGDAGTDISNQGMTLNGTAAGVLSDSNQPLIASPPDTSFATSNAVRTARILNIRAVATDANVLAKSIKVELPGDGVIDFYDDLMMVSVYQVVGTNASHTRNEIFGAEIVPPNLGATASVAPILEIRFNQLGLSAGDVFDLCVVV